MNLRRMYGMILRHLFHFKRSYDRIFDSFYWIALDLMLWGITGVYFQQLSPNAQQLTFMIMSGVILWNITYRAQIDINVSLLEELWNKNLINLFVSPLRFREWVGSLVILGMLKALLTFTFGSIIAYIFFKVTLLFYSFHLAVFVVLLMMSGWWIGFFISSLLLRYGTRIQTLGWSFVFMLSPFSAIYYPMETLPSWAQKISLIVPMSYVFEESRNLLFHGKINYQSLYICFALNIVYIILGIFALKSSFNKVLQKGLVKVY